MQDCKEIIILKSMPRGDCHGDHTEMVWQYYKPDKKPQYIATNQPTLIGWVSCPAIW